MAKNQHIYRNLIVEILDEPNYTFGSVDNNFKYSKHHFGEGGHEYPTSKHGIKIFNEDQLINDCIIIGSGGATSINPYSSIINNDELIICCCDTVYCLSIADLKLKWQKRADQVTCFGVYKLQNDYIIHGEIEISRLDKEGSIIWQFGGSDIFVSLDDESFSLNFDHIALTDFCKTKYKIDFDGKILV